MYKKRKSAQEIRKQRAECSGGSVKREGCGIERTYSNVLARHSQPNFLGVSRVVSEELVVFETLALPPELVFHPEYFPTGHPV